MTDTLPKNKCKCAPQHQINVLVKDGKQTNERKGLE